VLFVLMLSSSCFCCYVFFSGQWIKNNLDEKDFRLPVVLQIVPMFVSHNIHVVELVECDVD